MQITKYLILLLLISCQNTEVLKDGYPLFASKKSVVLFQKIKQKNDVYLQKICPYKKNQLLIAPTSRLQEITKESTYKKHHTYILESFYLFNSFIGIYLFDDEIEKAKIKHWFIEASSKSALLNLRPHKRYIPDSYATTSYMITILTIYKHLKIISFFNNDEIVKIESWLQKVISNIENKNNIIKRKYFGHEAGLHGTAFMLLGDILIDKVWLDKGIYIYKEMIKHLRRDGSSRFDVVPKKLHGSSGPWALDKQLQIVGFLTMIAEIASKHNTNLWSYSVSGNSISSAFSYLTQAITNQALVKKYTGENHHRTKFLKKLQTADQSTIWFTIFKRRMSNHPYLSNFEQLIIGPQHRFGAAYGGNLACLLP